MGDKYGGLQKKVPGAKILKTNLYGDMYNSHSNYDHYWDFWSILLIGIKVRR